MQRDCLAALAGANPLDHVVLTEAARLAGALGTALEDDSIEASYLAHWQTYASELEAVLGLVGVAMPAEWVLNSLAQHAAKIEKPQNGVY